jgi:hypothetical protein
MRSNVFPVAAALICLPLAAAAQDPDDWRVTDDAVWTLAAGEEPSVVVRCAEGKGTLVINVIPAWEEGYGTADGGVFAGPYDKVLVKIGDKTFDAMEDPAAASEDYDRAYSMPADADTVTAIMLGDNITVTLAADGQERSGTVDTTGAFDMFATTCAQINGL